MAERPGRARRARRAGLAAGAAVLAIGGAAGIAAALSAAPGPAAASGPRLATAAVVRTDLTNTVQEAGSPPSRACCAPSAAASPGGSSSTPPPATTPRPSSVRSPPGRANIMVISVLERRPEIGLRRALGATRRQVGAQFVTESVLLSALGGAGGWCSGSR